MLVIVGLITIPIEYLAYGGTFFGPVMIAFAIIDKLQYKPQED